MKKAILESAYDQNNIIRIIRNSNCSVNKSMIEFMLNNKDKFFSFLDSYALQDCIAYKKFKKDYNKMIYSINYKKLNFFFHRNSYCFNLLNKKLIKTYINSNFSINKSYFIERRVITNEILRGGYLNKLGYSYTMFEFLISAFMYSEEENIPLQKQIENITPAFERCYSISTNFNIIPIEKYYEFIVYAIRAIKYISLKNNIKIDITQTFISGITFYVKFSNYKNVEIDPTILIDTLAKYFMTKKNKINITRDDVKLRLHSVSEQNTIINEDLLDASFKEFFKTGNIGNIFFSSVIYEQPLSFLSYKICFEKNKFYIKNYDKVLKFLKLFFEIYGKMKIDHKLNKFIYFSFYILNHDKENFDKNVKIIFINERIFYYRLFIVGHNSKTISTFINKRGLFSFDQVQRLSYIQ